MRAAREREYVAYVETRVLRLRRIAYHLCGSWHAAEDLVQEALIRLYQHWGRASKAEHLDAYVRQILVRTYLDQTRRSWFGRIFPTSAPPDSPTTTGVDPDQRMDLAAAVNQLPPRQRAAVILRYFEGLDVNETASVLRCSPGTVKSQTFAALTKLRNLLPGYAGASRQPALKG